MWWLRASAPRLRCSPSWPRQGQVSELPASRSTGRAWRFAASPRSSLSGVEVRLPPGAFLQASRESEAVLVELVRQGVGRAKRVADLFAGIGTFTFALAASAEVDAFEEDEEAIAALAEAVRATPKLKPVRTHRPRSLPRAADVTRACPLRRRGARPAAGGRQGTGRGAGRLQGAKIVMVSCNPGTCARDLRILVDGGYRITRVVPVDQFLFSPHIELVAVLER